MIHALWLTVAVTLSGAVFAPLEDDSNFVEAQQLYEDLEFEQAIFRLQAAALVPGRPAYEQARIFVWLGICYGQSGDVSSARRAFADAVRADVDVALPVTVAPELEELLVAVREAEREKKSLQQASRTPEPSPDSDMDASASEPEANDPAAVRASEPMGYSVLWFSGAALGIAAAVGTGYLTYSAYDQAQNPATTQVDASAAVQNANIALYATGGVLGLAILSAGVGMWEATASP